MRALHLNSFRPTHPESFPSLPKLHSFSEISAFPKQAENAENVIYLFVVLLIGGIMGETLVRLEGAQEMILDKLVEAGIYKTRSEAIRAGVLGLGKEYGMFKTLQDVEDELAVRKMEKISREIDSGKRKVYTEAQVKKKYGFK